MFTGSTLSSCRTNSMHPIRDVTLHYSKFHTLKVHSAVKLFNGSHTFDRDAL